MCSVLCVLFFGGCLFPDDDLDLNREKEAFVVLWNSLTGHELKSEVAVREPDQNYIVNLGKHKCGEKVKLTASLVNKTPLPLEIASAPSCGCTVGFPKSLNLLPEIGIDVKTVVTFPRTPQGFSGNVACYDRKRDFSFTVTFVGEAVFGFDVQPSTIDIDAESLQEIDFCISPLDKSTEILSVFVGDLDASILSSEKKSSGDHIVKVRLSKPSPDIVSRFVNFQILTNGPVAEQSFAAKLNYSDRVSLFPRTAVFRVSENDMHIAKFSMIGKVVQSKDFQKDRIRCELTDGKRNISMNDFDYKVTERSASFEFRLRPSDLRDFALEGSNAWEMKVVVGEKLKVSIPVFIRE